MLAFIYPYFLLLFLFFPLFFFLKKTGLFFKPELKLNLLNWDSVNKPKQNTVFNFLNYISILFLCLGLIALIFSIAEPVIVRTKKVYTNYGNSIMFLIDISPSMAVKDMGGVKRIDVAKKMIKSFSNTHQSDALGLAVLASTASLLMPPTIDHKTFLMRLDALEIGELGDGTAIGMGLAVALASLENIKNNSYIILLTDGENNTGGINPRLVARILNRKNIGFYIIGIGKSGYAQLEYIDKKNNKRYKGSYYTEFNEKELKEIAFYSNGKYFSAESFNGLNEVLKKINLQIPSAETFFTETVEESLYFYFLFFSVFMFMASWCIRRIIMGIIND